MLQRMQQIMSRKCCTLAQCTYCPDVTPISGYDTRTPHTIINFQSRKSLSSFVTCTSETIEDPHDTAEFARAKIESLLAQHQPAGKY